MDETNVVDLEGSLLNFIFLVYFLEYFNHAFKRRKNRNMAMHTKALNLLKHLSQTAKIQGQWPIKGKK